MSTITLSEGGAAPLPPAERLAGSNCGTPGVWRFESDTGGPHVVITALVHGNEVCGAAALVPLLEQPPALVRGRLTLVFCNLEAYRRLDDANKSACRKVDEDLNRVWGRVDAALPGDATVELRRAREILPFVSGADVLLDLHSMTQPAPALGLVGRAAKNVEMARRIGFPGLLVQDPGHAAGLRLIDRAPYGDAAAAPVAMLVECGEHFSLAAIDAAREAVRRTLFAYLGCGSADAPVAQTVIEVTEAVTITTDSFEFVREWGNMEVVPAAGTLVGRDGEREVRTPHDDTYLVMPATEAFRKRGETAVRFARRVP
ncbi:MAG: succinylglutamate desuccinylase/aspartoacylase family protein [Burkholderiales bacterium]|nr:succinylglutamate desuccinylase/aspartoacylase family protein [Burkholderiales bacterium]